MTKKVLLVEDNEGDIKLIEEAISDNNLFIELELVKDGGQAMNYLESKISGGYTDLPDLIIMDLNLPKVQGKDLLKAFKEDTTIKKIPIVILTTSSLNADIDECFSYGANAYLIKPIDIIKFFDMMTIIDKFWLRTSCLPELN